MLDAADAVELSRTLVQAIRRVRTLRLVLNLGEVRGLDPINLGTLAAACNLGDDHHVAVFLDYPSAELADQLTAAGVPFPSAPAGRRDSARGHDAARMTAAHRCICPAMNLGTA